MFVNRLNEYLLIHCSRALTWSKDERKFIWRESYQRRCEVKFDFLLSFASYGLSCMAELKVLAGLAESLVDPREIAIQIEKRRGGGRPSAPLLLEDSKEPGLGVAGYEVDVNIREGAEDGAGR